MVQIFDMEGSMWSLCTKMVLLTRPVPSTQVRGGRTQSQRRLAHSTTWLQSKWYSYNRLCRLGLFSHPHDCNAVMHPQSWLLHAADLNPMDHGIAPSQLATHCLTMGSKDFACRLYWGSQMSAFVDILLGYQFAHSKCSVSINAATIQVPDT